MGHHLIKFGDQQVELTKNQYLSELLNYRQTYANIPTIKGLLDAAISTIEALATGYLPPALPVMEIPEAVIEELQNYVLQKYPRNEVLGNRLWQQLTEPLEVLDYQLRHLRDELITTFAMYGYVSSPLINTLDQELGEGSALELMAGKGYLTAGLRAVNPARKVIATDTGEWVAQPDMTEQQTATTVETLDALAALVKYGAQVDYVLISWAPDTTEIDWAVLQYLREHADELHCQLIVVGEREGATNSARFWAEADLTEMVAINTANPSFDLIDERFYRVK